MITEVHGHLLASDADALVRPRWLINFPTKRHWTSASRPDDIESGLDDLRRVLVEFDNRSIAVPTLGCGNGGLHWADVRPMIERKLADLDIDIRLYPPEEFPK